MIATELKSKLQNKVEKTKNGHTIVGPHDPSIPPLQRAQDHLFLIGEVYGNGHPASAATPEMIMTSQESGDMLTWLLYENGQAVGMANMEVLPNGIGELCRTCRLPVGTQLQDGTTLRREVKNTAAMYQRLLDVLTNPDMASRLAIIQADLRLAEEISIPGSEPLDAGVKTQHINFEAGLSPWLLCVPRYQVHIEGKEPHQEAFLQSRMYLQPENISTEPLYLYTNSTQVVSNEEIAKATYEYAYNASPTIVHESETTAPGYSRLERTADIHFSTIYASGNIEAEQLQAQVAEGLNQSRMVEVIIENAPENIAAQKAAEKAGLIPMGVQPGGTFDVAGSKITIPTTIHYGTARPEVRKRIVPIEVARELKNTMIENVTHKLHQQWLQVEHIN